MREFFEIRDELDQKMIAGKPMSHPEVKRLFKELGKSAEGSGFLGAAAILYMTEYHVNTASEVATG